MTTYTFISPRPLEVDVRNAAGSISVDASAGDQATVSVRPQHDDRASREAAEETTVEFSEEENTLLVKVPERRYGRQPRLTIEVSVPTESALTVHTASADVRVGGTLASAQVWTASGDIQLSQVAGDLSVNSASGNAYVDTIGGNASFNTASGDVRLGAVGGSCRVQSASGDVRIDEAASDVRARTASGDVTVRSATAGTVEANTVSGDVTVGVLPGTLVWLDLATFTGSTRSGLDSEEPPSEGGARLEIKVKTVSGDISVGRAKVAGAA